MKGRKGMLQNTEPPAVLVPQTSHLMAPSPLPGWSLLIAILRLPWSSLKPGGGSR